MSIERPLAGVTVVEATGPRSTLALSLATAMCGRLACDLGANVVRFETAERRLVPALDGFLNYGKRRIETSAATILADLEGASGPADCLVVDIGVYDAVGKAHPRTVAIAMSADDPLGGSEFTIEARSGLLDLVGDPEREPLRLGGHQIPYAAGLAAYLAMVEMLTKRDGADRVHRRVDLLDVAVWLNWKAIGGAALGLPVPSRTGRDGDWSIAPCRDGFVALVYRSSDWETLKRMLDDARLDDPRFESEAGRRRHRAALNAILRDAVAPLDRTEIRRLSLEYRIPLGPVWTSDELRRDPHMLARSFFHVRPIADTTLVLPAAPVKWNGRTFAPADGGVPLSAAV